MTGLITTGSPSLASISWGLGAFSPVKGQGPGHLEAGLLIDGLAQLLVHGQGRGQDPGALVGDLQEVQETLHGAVLPAPAVHDDQGHVQLFGLPHQTLQVRQGIVAPDVVFVLIEGLIDLGAAFQRDFPLRGFAPGDEGQPQFSHDSLRKAISCSSRVQALKQPLDLSRSRAQAQGRKDFLLQGPGPDFRGLDAGQGLGSAPVAHLEVGKAIRQA